MGKQIDQALTKIRKRINKLRSIEYFLMSSDFEDLTNEEEKIIAKLVEDENLQDIKKLFSIKDLENLENKPTRILKHIASTLLIKGWSRMTKVELILHIKDRRCGNNILQSLKK